MSAITERDLYHCDSREFEDCRPKPALGLWDSCRGN